MFQEPHIPLNVVQLEVLWDYEYDCQQFQIPNVSHHSVTFKPLHYSHLLTFEPFKNANLLLKYQVRSSVN